MSGLRQYIRRILIEGYYTESDIVLPPPPRRDVLLQQIPPLLARRENPETCPDLKEALDTGGSQLFNEILLENGYPDHLAEIDRLKMEIRPIIYLHKDYFNLDRPYALAAEEGITMGYDYLETAQTPSYPSGHTAQAYYVAYSLSSRFPDLEEEFLGLAKTIEESRIDRGVHYFTDNDAGKLLALKFFMSRNDK